MAPTDRDHYEVLGVPPDASAPQIRRAFRRLARQYHPDLCDAGNARARFEELSTAYAVLHDPRARARYDRSRVAARARPAFVAPRVARDMPRFANDRPGFRVQVTVRFRVRWPPW